MSCVKLKRKRKVTDKEKIGGQNLGGKKEKKKKITPNKKKRIEQK